MGGKGRPGTAPEAGLVVAAYGRRYRVELVGGKELACVTRGRKSDVACGDRVSVSRTGGGGVIEAVEPRKTLFYRSDARRQKLIAANVTQVVLVLAPVPPWYDDLVSRCIAGAEHAGVQTLIVLNKSDLPEAPAAAQALDLYTKLGYSVMRLSAKIDISPLRARLAGHTSVLLGQSGMGKSTIINALVPNATARVGEISEALASGRHTTTHAELYHLEGAANINDSPGLQEFGLNHIKQEDLADAFVEFRPFLGHCRFRDCRHMEEPDCAVARAVAAGEIAERRLASYRRIAGELAHAVERMYE